MSYLEKNDFIIDQNLNEFFDQQINSVLTENNHEITQEAKFYLVDLLTQFSNQNTFYEKDDRGELQDKPLAIRWLESLISSHDKSFFSLKKIGDISLYTAGFFSESIVRKLINLDYYMNMGHLAYLRLARMNQRKKSLNQLFEELGSKFPILVDIITEIAHQSRSHDNQNLIALFEKWQATGSKHIQKILEKKGIITQFFPSINRSKH